MIAVNLLGPASQPGVPTPMPQAAISFTLLAVIVPTALIAFGPVMYGMRGEPDLRERTLFNRTSPDSVVAQLTLTPAGTKTRRACRARPACSWSKENPNTRFKGALT